MQLPYVRFPHQPAHHNTAPPLQDFVNKLAALCGAQHQRLAFPTPPESSEPHSSSSSSSSSSWPDSKHVLWMSMPAVTESAGARKRSVAEHGTCATYIHAHDHTLPQPKKKLTGHILLFAR
jgi:hypothetical protein